MLTGIVTRIKKANSEDEIRKLINYHNWTNPSGKMRRIALRAARERRAELGQT